MSRVVGETCDMTLLPFPSKIVQSSLDRFGSSAGPTRFSPWPWTTPVTSTTSKTFASLCFISDMPLVGLLLAGSQVRAKLAVDRDICHDAQLG